MDPLQFPHLMHRTGAELAFSALPDAPVVPESTPRWARSRFRAAGALHRLADLVAPEAPRTRPTLGSGRGYRQLRWDESPCRPSPTASA